MKRIEFRELKWWQKFIFMFTASTVARFQNCLIGCLIGGIVTLLLIACGFDAALSFLIGWGVDIVVLVFQCFCIIYYWDHLQYSVYFAEDER